MAENEIRRQLNLVQKLAKIRVMSDVVSKDKRGYNYTYADITTILAKITAGMKKYGVSLIPQITPNSASVTQNVTENTKVDKAGNVYNKVSTEMLVSSDMIFRWVNDDDPNDYMDVPWFVVGSQDDPSQAFGSGLTYCTRYFLTNFFQIAQPDSDIDSYRSKQKEAEDAENKIIVESVINEFDAILRQYLAQNPDKTEDVKQFTSKYAKDGNYFSIKEPNLASKLMSEFKENFLAEE